MMTQEERSYLNSSLQRIRKYERVAKSKCPSYIGIDNPDLYETNICRNCGLDFCCPYGKGPIRVANRIVKRVGRKIKSGIDKITSPDILRDYKL